MSARLRAVEFHFFLFGLPYCIVPVVLRLLVLVL